MVECFNGKNNWILDTPDDNRHILYIAPSQAKNNLNWNWGRSISVDSSGRSAFRNDMQVNGIIQANKVKAPEFKVINSAGQEYDIAPKGMIVMWSGTTPPAGWSLCDGKGEGTSGKVNGVTIPNLSGKFIIGYNKDDGSYNGIGKSGGSYNIKLQERHLPKHSHTGTTNIKGSHKHDISNNGNHNHTGNTNTTGNHNHTGNTNTTGNHNHNGSTSNDGDHRHNRIYTNFGRQMQQDDFNNSGGSGYSCQRGNSDNGYLYTGNAGTHRHSYTTNTTGNHNHSYTTNTTGNHNHSYTTNTTGNHNHNMNNSGLHSHTFTTSEVGSNSDIDIRPKYYTLAYIIKCF